MVDELLLPFNDISSLRVPHYLAFRFNPKIGQVSFLQDGCKQCRPKSDASDQGLSYQTLCLENVLPNGKD